MVADAWLLITLYKEHWVYGETERRGWLLINHGGEITDLGGGYLTLVQGSQQTTLHLFIKHTNTTSGTNFTTTNTS